jgi:hypothetical protein
MLYHMRRSSGLRIAGTLVGGPFLILIKVSLLVFVALVVGPFWLAVKLVPVLAEVVRALFMTVVVIVRHFAGTATCPPPAPQARWSNRR